MKHGMYSGVVRPKTELPFRKNTVIIQKNMQPFGNNFFDDFREGAEE